MELVFLGTGAGVPAKYRNVSAAALIMPEYKGETWLFDCGEATQHQILHTKVKLPKIKKIFITHMHGDHIYGLPGLLGSRSFQGGSDTLLIYGPPGIRAFVEQTLTLSATHLTYPIEITEIAEGRLMDDDHFRVSVKKLEHGIPSYGFRIEEKDKPGALLVDKIKEELGLTPGPVYQKFKNEETITLSDGRIVQTADFVGPSKKGRILVILGDTRPCSPALALSEHADVLIHEGTFLSDKKTSANAFFHSTSKQAAETAKDAKVGALILTHISSRYQENSIDLLEEAKTIFPHSYLAEDFWTYDF